MLQAATTYDRGMTGDYDACASSVRRDLCWIICCSPFNGPVLLPARYVKEAASVGGLFCSSSLLDAGIVLISQNLFVDFELLRRPPDFLHANVAAHDQAEAGVFRQRAGFSLPSPESKRGRISATPAADQISSGSKAAPGKWRSELSPAGRISGRIPSVALS